MMSNIVLKNENINNYVFIQSFNKLKNHPFDAKTLYTITYLDRKIQRISKDAGDVYSKIVKKYAKLNEQGFIIPEKDEKGNPIPGTFELREDAKQEDFENEVKEFMSIEHDMNKTKFDVNRLVEGGYPLTANDISALEPLLSGLDD